jgi:hypothetical protein
LLKGLDIGRKFIGMALSDKSLTKAKVKMQTRIKTSRHIKL